MFAIVDCNCFFVSCERVFQPEYKDVPVVVLSNNDGCVISRSTEAKKLGIPMAAAYFKYRDMMDKNGVKAFSTNFALYGDMSERVMHVLSHFARKMEVYSIDEAFMLIDDDQLSMINKYDENNHMNSLGMKIKEVVYRWTGIPVSVGIAPTKTLAKAANNLAKKNSDMSGVCVLPIISDKLSMNDKKLTVSSDFLLDCMDVDDVWGVGRAYNKLLRKNNVVTAYDLKCLDKKWAQEQMGIMGVRMVNELNGIQCFGLSDGPDDQKSVLVSRTFVREISDFRIIRQTVARFVGMACEKLRKKSLNAGYITIFLSGNRLEGKDKYWLNKGEKLEVPVSFTSDISKVAMRVLGKMHQSGKSYKRAGVLLTDLSPSCFAQKNLFTDNDGMNKKNVSVLKSIDKINASFGRNTVGFASAGFGDKVTTVQNMRSARFTTRWDEVLEIGIK